MRIARGWACWRRCSACLRERALWRRWPCSCPPRWRMSAWPPRGGLWAILRPAMLSPQRSNEALAAVLTRFQMAPGWLPAFGRTGLSPIAVRFSSAQMTVEAPRTAAGRDWVQKDEAKQDGRLPVAPDWGMRRVHVPPLLTATYQPHRVLRKTERTTYIGSDSDGLASTVEVNGYPSTGGGQSLGH